MPQRTPMFTLTELTQNLDITLQGDPHCKIHNIATIQEACAGDLAFLVNPLYKKYLPTTKASAIILSAKDAKECPTNAIIARDPYFIFAKIAHFFQRKPSIAAGIHPSVILGKDCKIHPSVSIGANSSIGSGVGLAAGVVIGSGCVVGDWSEIDENTFLHANVTLYDSVKLGKRVTIASGAVIGSDGFGLAKHGGVWHKIPQLGRVIIEDDVDVGANTTIDRGAIGDTVIEKGAKLDNLIQVGHNVRIGENTAIAGCVGIAGSATIGKNCMIAGAAGISGHVTIADNVVITGMTVVSKSIQEPGIYSSGAGGLMTNLEWRKNSARLHRLDRLEKRVKALEANKES